MTVITMHKFYVPSVIIGSQWMVHLKTLYRLYSLSHSPNLIAIRNIEFEIFSKKTFYSNPQSLCQSILPTSLTTCATDNGDQTWQVSLYCCNSFVIGQRVFVTAEHVNLSQVKLYFCHRLNCI